MILGLAPLVDPEPDANLATILEWADDARRLRVYANADTPVDAQRARENGAEGIGLCRTEHMFMAADRLPIVREMILASTDDERADALARLLPMQQSDFEGIFAAMAGPAGDDPAARSAAARVPSRSLRGRRTKPSASGSRRYAKRTRCSGHAVADSASSGLRSTRCRSERSSRAAQAVTRRTGVEPIVEIMHPLVAFVSELERLVELTARTIAEEGGIDYRVGTMIELPRAALARGRTRRARRVLLVRDERPDADDARRLARRRAGAVPDLLPPTTGCSTRDPFQTIDVDGVGELVRIAVERGRAVRPSIEIGICGEHGGDPASIAFCEYARSRLRLVLAVSYPVARLAAAQAALAAQCAIRAGRRLNRVTVHRCRKPSSTPHHPRRKEET